MPTKFYIDDSHFLPPAKDPDKVEIVRGPNIKPLPLKEPLKEVSEGEIIIKLKDNISTDEILPAGARVLPLRSNIPAISEYVFAYVDPNFVKRVKEKQGGFIVAGENYGQGSSREHAAIAPMYLCIKAVLVKSFARIHKGNLINFGILPLEFANPKDYEMLQQGGRMVLRAVPEHVKSKDRILAEANGNRFELKINLTERNREIILAGGLLNYIKNRRS
jgi:aconitate hydratase